MTSDRVRTLVNSPIFNGDNATDIHSPIQDTSITNNSFFGIKSPACRNFVGSPLSNPGEGNFCLYSPAEQKVRIKEQRKELSLINYPI